MTMTMTMTLKDKAPVGGGGGGGGGAPPAGSKQVPPPPPRGALAPHSPPPHPALLREAQAQAQERCVRRPPLTLHPSPLTLALAHALSLAFHPRPHPACAQEGAQGGAQGGAKEGAQEGAKLEEAERAWRERCAAHREPGVAPVAESETFEVVVPTDAQPGDIMTLTTQTGQRMKVSPRVESGLRPEAGPVPQATRPRAPLC